MEKIEKLTQHIGKPIGRNKYEALKSFGLDNVDEDRLKALHVHFPGLTVAEALKMIETYEERNKKSDIDSTKQIAEYFERIHAPKPEKEKKELTKETLFGLFDKNYFEQNSVKYSREADSLENLKPLIYYFIGDYENFKKCDNVSKLSVPSFSKGLLLIGGYGNGKTSVMKALQASLARTNVSFRTKTANDAVSEFEACPDNEHKEEFWKTYNNGVWNFDDLLTEREASNYGKVNIFKDILEVRYEKKKRTYATCNLDDRYPGDVEKGILQLGEKYGSRVFDRLFLMFNIIEFKGKSYRK